MMQVIDIVNSKRSIFTSFTTVRKASMFIRKHRLLNLSMVSRKVSILEFIYLKLVFQ